MVLSAFAALHDPDSRPYYDRCRARGKTHTQTLLRLARHRISVLFAMLRDGTLYQPRSPRTAWRKTQRPPARVDGCVTETGLASPHRPQPENLSRRAPRTTVSA